MSSLGYSQISFYVKPSAFIKTNNSNLYGEPSNFTNSLPNKYFTLINQGTHINYNSIDLSGTLGVVIKNKHFVEIGISQDNIGMKSSVFQNLLFKDDVLNHYYPTASSSLFAKPLLRSDINYAYKVWSSNNKIFGVRTNLSFGLFINRYANRKKGIIQYETLYPFLPGNIPEDNLYYQKYTIEISGGRRISPYIGAGIGIDFHTRKGRNILSIDINYKYNFYYMYLFDHDIVLIDEGKVKNYKYDFVSRGSGFYIEISRRFQLYPWIPLSKKKRLAKETGI